MNQIAEEILMHYGTPRHSGRYPWGSGDNPFQHSGDFLSRINELKKENFTFTDEDGKTYKGESAIARYFGLSTTQLRAYKSIANAERRGELVSRAKQLSAEGYTPTQIAKEMGYTSESSIRNLLNEESERRMKEARSTADFLIDRIKEVGMIDVGAGTEIELNVSKERMKQALEILQAEGYPVYGMGIPQVTNPGQQTNTKIACPPGTPYKDVYKFGDIHSVKDYISYDGGDTFKKGFVYPESMDSKRLKINYAEDGGVQKDGVIEIRRGVKDLSLGNSNYAQVRILVDGDRYLKGMAVYSDDLPDGVDVLFNTNKKRGTPMRDVLKPITNDPDNPFGSAIKEHGGQSYYTDSNGKQKLSLINKRAEEGDWGSWSDKLPSQFLSKQPIELVRKQLNLTIADKREEYNKIKELTNPTIKKHFLKSFAEDCDATAVDLQAAALPRQKYQVILPLKNIKDNEVYAPNYNSGETVALIRYPHGGTFEIPILKVNNKNSEGRKVMGANPLDAIGINSKVAERLSGADFDGDTVMVIPCNSLRSKVKINSIPPLEALKDFDPKMEYGGKPEGTFRALKKGQVQNEMGSISNLITDMTIKGANETELAKAVKHSMVVIDAYKHKLDYKQSEIDNDIKTLKRTYQGRYEDGRYKEGASTLISRAGAEVSVPKRQGSPIIDKETGEVSYKTADDLYYTDRNGKRKMRTQPSTQMAETRDAYTLSSGYTVENEYARFANTMKAVANDARKTMLNTGKIAYSASAKAKYSEEVAELDKELKNALRNAPRERQAMAMANSIVKAKEQDNPGLTKEEKKKISQQALTSSRIKVGAKRNPIHITDRQWEAIQAGAVSETTLTKILNHSDDKELRERATPRESSALSTAKINKIKAMAASGYANSEIAEAIGVSSSTITKYLK